jgi:hypothetical protein
VRWNDARNVEVTADGTVRSIQWRTGDSQFDHDRYQCDTCFGDLHLPAAAVLADQDWS